MKIIRLTKKEKEAGKRLGEWLEKMWSDEDAMRQRELRERMRYRDSAIPYYNWKEPKPDET